VSLSTRSSPRSSGYRAGSRPRHLRRRADHAHIPDQPDEAQAVVPLDTPSHGASYLPSLDGLRALAVLAVIVYHARPDWLPGGFLGVDVFFAISGFIITRTLLSEWQERHAIDIRLFYLRRIRRLQPALATVIIAALVYSLAFDPAGVARLRLDALAAAGQVANWRFVLANQSYFESFARPSALRHLWSLAVEEQFYMVWPLFMATGLRFLRPSLLALPVILLAAGSYALMLWLSSHGAGVSRLYYGTDTRAAGLLIGAALALLWTARPARVTRLKAAALDLTGVAALCSLAIAVFVLDESRPFLYRGGFGLIALASSLLIFTTVNQTGLLSRFLGIRPLRWIGQRSYGIYLWHWPLALLTWPRLPSPLETGAEIVAAVAIAGLSYRFVERPVRDGALGRLLDGLRGRIALQPLRRAALILTTAGTISAVLALAILVAAAKRPQVPAYLAAGSVRLISDSAGQGVSPAEVTVETFEEPPPQAEVPTTTWIAISQDDVEASTEPAPPESLAARVLPPAPAPVYLPVEGSPLVTAVGDSVMLGAAQQLAARIPRVDIDAAISRQTSQAVLLLWDRLQEGTLGEVVVVNLGNNGTFNDAQFDQIMAIAGPTRRVVFVNNKVPRRWEETNNAVISSGVRRYANAVLVDWHSEGEARPDFFLDDSVHLRPEGANAFANMVAAAVRG